MVQGKPTISPDMQDGFLLPPLIMLRQKDTDSKTAVPSILSTGRDGDIFLPQLDMLRQKDTDSKTAVPSILSTGRDGDIFLPQLDMLRQKDTDSKTAVPSILSTGIDDDAFLPPLDMLRQKNTDPETTAPSVSHTHNQRDCNSNEEIDSTSEVDLFSMFYSEFSEETTYYKEEQVDTRPAGRGRRHHKRHGKNGRRHRHAQRSRDQREESPAVIDSFPGIIMDALFKQ